MKNLGPIRWRQSHYQRWVALHHGPHPIHYYIPSRHIESKELAKLDLWCITRVGTPRSGGWGRGLVSEHAGTPPRPSFWFADPKHTVQFLLTWQGIDPREVTL